MNEWYRVMRFGKNQEPRCPKCDNIYPYGPIFDHHKKTCPYCGTTLIELLMKSAVYLVDYEKAPASVKFLVSYLDQFTEQEAYEELMHILVLFGAERE